MLIIVVIGVLACGGNVKRGGGNYTFILVRYPKIAIESPICSPTVFNEPCAVALWTYT